MVVMESKTERIQDFCSREAITLTGQLFGEASFKTIFFFFFFEGGYVKGSIALH